MHSQLASSYLVSTRRLHGLVSTGDNDGGDTSQQALHNATGNVETIILCHYISFLGLNIQQRKRSYEKENQVSMNATDKRHMKAFHLQDHARPVRYHLVAPTSALPSQRPQHLRKLVEPPGHP